MRIIIPYLYTTEVIPPRCRKPRTVELSATIALTIREVSSKDAPIAIVEQGQGLAESGENQEMETVYRWYRRRLYVHASFQRFAHAPRETQTASQFRLDPYPFSLTRPNQQDRHRTQTEHLRDFRSWGTFLLFIDGERWEQTEEPRYVLMTFGLGHNHGLGWGTELSTTNFHNPNIHRSRYFRADQYQAALDEATRVATARGDTKALPIEAEQNPTRFDIRIPEAIRLKPRRQ